MATLTDALRSLTAAEILVAFRQRFLPWDGVALQRVLDGMVLSRQLQRLPVRGEDRYALPAGGSRTCPTASAPADSNHAAALPRTSAATFRISVADFTSCVPPIGGAVSSGEWSPCVKRTQEKDCNASSSVA
jgi:hypothetical protein